MYLYYNVFACIVLFKKRVYCYNTTSAVALRDSARHQCGHDTKASYMSKIQRISANTDTNTSVNTGTNTGTNTDTNTDRTTDENADTNTDKRLCTQSMWTRHKISHVSQQQLPT